MKKMVCELCGSNDFTKDDAGFFVCDYCRTKYTPEQAQKMLVEGTVRVDRSDEAEKYLRLAEAALDDMNSSEAYSYANKALEIDTENGRAWFAKGRAAGWTSGLASVNYPEMIGAFERAVSYTEETDGKDELRKRAADEMVKVVTAVQRLSHSEVDESPELDAYWDNHVRRTQDSIETLFRAHRWGAGRPALELIVDLAQSLNKGPMYRDQNEKLRQRELRKSQKKQFEASIERAAAEIRFTDPAYEVPKQSSCFVVTATMGSETSMPVQVLRRFRDDVLVETGPGQRFITWYGANGPTLAATIAPHRTLRVASLVVIVLPATLVARVALELQSLTRVRR